MASRRKKTPTVSFIIGIAVVISIFLYLAGVFSGLYANKILEERTTANIESFKFETKKDIDKLKQGTEEDIDYLKNYLIFLESNLQDIQQEQFFADALSETEQCTFSVLTLQKQMDHLRYFWSILPFRIEEYEKYNELTDEYLSLKKQYTQVSIKTWIYAKKISDKCNQDLTHGLYFYSANCTTCIRQGEQLDRLAINLDETNQSLMLFTIDIDSDEPLVRIVKDYYGVSSAPAVVINNELFQSNLTTTEKLLEFLGDEK